MKILNKYLITYLLIYFSTIILYQNYLPFNFIFLFFESYIFLINFVFNFFSIFLNINFYYIDKIYLFFLKSLLYSFFVLNISFFISLIFIYFSNYNFFRNKKVNNFLKFIINFSRSIPTYILMSLISVIINNVFAIYFSNIFFSIFYLTRHINKSLDSKINFYHIQKNYSSKYFFYIYNLEKNMSKIIYYLIYLFEINIKIFLFAGIFLGNGFGNLFYKNLEWNINNNLSAQIFYYFIFIYLINIFFNKIKKKVNNE